MSTHMGLPAPLHLLRLRPDLAALARWAAATRQRALRDDMGYAMHGALRATLGELAPKPFALLQRPASLQLIGYSTHAQQELATAIDMAATSDPLAAEALGFNNPGAVVLKPMPQEWAIGLRLSFEVRVAPIVRSRAQPGGGYPEMDAAFHPDFALQAPGDRDAAYGRWLAREVERGGAATLIHHRTESFQLTPMTRRHAREETEGKSKRTLNTGLLPDLTVRGQLQIQSSPAFNALLARGLGRHRSFGFGCLLLAPAGAWN